MYPTDTPAISDGTSTHVYSIVEIGANKCSRREAAAPSDLPAILLVQHQAIGKGVSKRTRSNVQFNRDVKDALGNYGTVKASFTLDWPSVITTAATAQKQLNELIAFFALPTYKDKLTNLEI
jgi:hypothetical protein